MVEGRRLATRRFPLALQRDRSGRPSRTLTPTLTLPVARVSSSFHGRREREDSGPDPVGFSDYAPLRTDLPAVVPAILPNTEPDTRPVPPG